MKALADLRPLDGLPTIRSKLGSITVFAVAVTVASLYVLVGFALRDSARELAFQQSLQAAHDLATQAFDAGGAPSPTLAQAAQHAGTFALVLDASGHVLQSSMPAPHTVARALAGAVDSGTVRNVAYVGVPVVRDGAVAGAVYVGSPADTGISALLATAELLKGFWWQLLAAGFLAAAIGLFSARLLARGMTTPLREMAAAARRMAHGDYRDRVQASSRDEVGQLADAFNRMASQLEGVEQSRRELVGNVSHELRTPISALQAHLENLLDGVEEPNPSILALMLGQCERLARLVEQLLDLSRLESGDVHLELEPVSLGPLVQQVVAEVGVARAGRAIQVHNQVSGGLPTIMADRERLHQVLFNLLDNAFRFTPGGGTVRVEAHVEAGACQVSVSDTGPGIPEEHLRRVFERFYRVDSSRSRSDGGTGIGLAIARSVVEAHGGGIWAESPGGGGATFRFSLPAPVGMPAQGRDPLPATSGTTLQTSSVNGGLPK